MTEQVTQSPKEPWNLDEWFEKMKKDPSWGPAFAKLSPQMLRFLQTAAEKMYKSENIELGLMQVLDEMPIYLEVGTPEEMASYRKYEEATDAAMRRHGINYFKEDVQKILLEDYLPEGSQMLQLYSLTLIVSGPLVLHMQDVRENK